MNSKAPSDLMDAMREAFDYIENTGVVVDKWLERIAQIRLGDHWDCNFNSRAVKSLKSNALNRNRLHQCGLAVVEVLGVRYITTQVHAEVIWNGLKGHQ